MSGTTPYLGIRYPLSGEVIDPAAEQAMATDMDVLANEAAMLAGFGLGRIAGNVSCTSPPSLVKNTLTTITWTSGSAAFWAAANPTRITIQVPGVYVIQTDQLLGPLAAGNVSTLRVMVAKNGATTQPNIQAQMTPQFQAGQVGSNLCTVWTAVQGDFFEVKALWNGAAAGPFSLELFPQAQIFSWSFS